MLWSKTQVINCCFMYIDCDSYYYQCAGHSIGVGCTGVPEAQVDDQRGDHGAHDGRRHEEGVSVRQSGAGGEIKDEILVDPGALPHE
jgi:hypothetical protein